MSPPAWPRRCVRRTWDASARCSPRTGGTSRRSTRECGPTRWRAWSRRSRPSGSWGAKRRARAPADRSSFWPRTARAPSPRRPGRPAPPCSPWRGRRKARRHGDRRGARAGEILRAYAARYLRYPNRDNVLGPSRLFFSTYLESLWICNILAAAVLLRESDNLDEATTRAVNQVADEAANLIGEFDEWFSNRQTWNNAALAAIAYWFEDEDLASRAIESPTGLLAHLMRGFGPDGMWYEGENYHLFALRGLLTGVAWAAQAGIDVFAEAALAERVRAALLAPARSALPDFTFPARKDSRFGVSLAHPMYLELWEVGLANLGERGAGSGTPELASWLTTLYRTAATKPELFESYLHDAPMEPLPAPRSPSRTSLSWWALLFMEPQLPSHAAAWAPASILLDAQGLAILLTRDRYAR